MRITVRMNKAMEKFLTSDVMNPVSMALTKVALLVQNRAKEIAPYLTGTLRRSITSDFANIKNGIVVVGSPVPYARLRHRVNRKNPQTLRYLERGYTEQVDFIRNVFERTLQQYYK